MVVWLKTEREAEWQVRSTTEGFESWKPWAPGVGRNSEIQVSMFLSEVNVDEGLTVVHEESTRLVMAIPALQGLVLRAVAVLLVHESTRNRTRTRIHVLVRTPARKINIPLVQLQFNITSCMSEIPSDRQTLRVGVLGDGWDVQELATVVLYSRKQNQSQLISMLIDQRKDLLRRDEIAIIWFDFEHALFRTQSMPLDL